jgi:uncharacterized protein (DUF3820 family)
MEVAGDALRGSLDGRAGRGVLHGVLEEGGRQVKMPFGKHKGEEICDLDLSYIKWLERQPWISENIRDEVQFEIERREGDVTSLGRAVRS